MAKLTWAQVIEVHTAPEPEYQQQARTPNCVACGRFCRIISDRIGYDGNFSQNYVTFDCKHCGVFTESMW